MEATCPIDLKCASTISALLRPPPPSDVQDYFIDLLASRQCQALKVTQNAHFGKGVFADVEIKEDEVVLKDKMLVGAQHSSNKIDCLVCGYCFQFIGSIELQIGRKLYLQSLGLSVSTGCHNHGRTSNAGTLGESSNAKVDKVPFPSEAVGSLMNGGITLPYSDKLPLPEPVSCFGGCQEVNYCSKLCAEADWEHSHSLLCTGERSKSHSREALSEFIQHANETNDIFLLAAKTIAFTILRYWKLKAACLAGECKHSESAVLECLLEAWKPVSFGYKKRWWDCISLPDDVDSSEENAFRTEIKDLAFTSLQLLKTAIFDRECEPLFSLEIYGNIIGMFELNNLDLVVASPVEDYFLYIDDLPQSEKIKVQEITQPLLDALGDDYSVCCQGSAFYPLQSCMNHSCNPNAKAFKREEDRDGQATILAIRAIRKGEEVTISYIDEELPFEERQAALADYGFRCSCTKCLDENSEFCLDE